jgi:uncharacterized cupredoxin-like copper-binding protein
MRIGSVALAALATGALAVAGCGGDDEEEGASGGAAPQTTARQTATSGKPASGVVRLSETEFEITPAEPSVAKPGTVSFVVSNDGQAVHALEVVGPEGEVETDEIAPGGSARLKVKLSKAGTYEMYCPVGDHQRRGMTGEVKVAGGGSGASSDDGGSESTSDRPAGY